MDSRRFLDALLSAKPVDRRQFLKEQMRAALLLAAGVGGLSAARPLHAAAAPDIAVAQGDPGPATRKAVEMLGGMGRFVKPGQKVVIKPNMSFSHDVDRATNTHPEVVRELVLMCREAGAARIRVLDHPLRSVEMCIEGVKQVCDPIEPGMVQGLVDDRFFVEVPVPRGEQMKRTEVMRDVLDADALIAAPVAKSHGSAGVSLSMKGMMGLIYNRRVMHSRYSLHEAIVDLSSLLTPALAVVDATRVLTTHGPSGPGKVIRPRTVVASTDMVAADAQTVSMFEWYGRKFEPRQVQHIRIAHERGLGRMDVENLNVARAEV